MSGRGSIVLSTLILAAAGSTTSAQEYELVWSDEFDGTSLNTSNWEPLIGDGEAYGLPSGWGNNELQWYLGGSSNIEVSDGTLKITARRQNFNGKSYTSARLRSRGLQEFRYGRIEARLRIPSAPGIWPAFWMLPTDSPYGGWAAGGEIDIMESVDEAERVHGTLHHGGEWPQNTSTGGSLHHNQVNGVTDFGDDFHTYAIEWGPDQIRWLFDGQVFSIKNSNQWFSTNAPGNPSAPFDVRFHLLLNVAVGGNFPSEDPQGNDFPQVMEVDWVRVSAPAQTPFGGSAWAIPGQVEAEDFDVGIYRQATFDTEQANLLGAYRDEEVDIEAASEGGYNVAWNRSGEWIEYTVDVAQAGTYEVEVRVATPHVGNALGLSFDGTDVSGVVPVPTTGGWQAWQTVTTTVELEAGEQIMRYTHLGSQGSEFNINWFRFTLVDEPCVADLSGDGNLNNTDINLFVSAFLAEDPAADLNTDGNWNNTDINAFVNAFLAGCD